MIATQGGAKDQDYAVRLESVSKAYGSNQVLHGVDLNMHYGEVISLIGPSGSGKSTLLRCCNLLEVPEGGRVEVGGVTFLDSQNPKADTGSIRELRTRTSMVFQNFELFPHLTASENVALAPRLVRKSSRKIANDKAVDLLGRVGLADLRGRYPGQLSGGQQQRVAIARALAMEPKVLLVDEPTSALDPEMVGEVLVILRDLAQQGTTMLVVTHEMRFARDVASRVVVMDRGSIVEEGDPNHVLRTPNHPTTKAFLRALEGSLVPYENNGR